MSDAPAGARSRALSIAAVALLAAATVSAPWRGHVDDTDAQLYQVVVRNMVRSQDWMNLSYLPGVHAAFREHLPFGLWPFALAATFGGERTLPVVAALFTLGALGVTCWLGERRGPRGTGLAAALLLAVTESFFAYGGRPRLDPLLVLLSTWSAAIILVDHRGAGRWLAAAVIAAGAALVKGPFGLVPLVAASLALAVATRSLRPLLSGAAAATAAAIPVAVFLLWDRAHGQSWWNGYWRGQLLASATAERMDGSTAWWFPFASIAGRFWPGFVLLAFAAVRTARGRPEAVPYLLWALFTLVLLCIPGRKVWNHQLIAFPALALAGAASIAPWAANRRAPLVLGALAAVTLGAAGAGAGRLLLRPPCVVSVELAPALDRLRPGEEILVISSPVSWRTVAELAAERDLSVWIAEGWDSLPAAQHAGTAMVQEDLAAPSSAPEGWRQAGSGRGWVLMTR